MLRVQQTPTVGSAIEWICLNIPNEQLPPRFATSERSGRVRTASGGGLQLLHAADPHREQRQSLAEQQGHEAYMHKDLGGALV